jgi:hypothetical protein
MRTLIMQVYEQGKFHANAITQKRGLVQAFAAHGDVLDFDYFANDRATLFDGMVIRLDQFQPDIVFTQIQGSDIFTPAQIRELRTHAPTAVWCNWSGDSWAWSLTSPEMLALAHEYDLWLVAAPDVLPIYAENSINARFWQIGLEQPEPPLPEMPTYDVVFMGNVISEKRRALLEFLRGLEGVSVGIYGDWDKSDGHNTYNFAEGESLYKNATLAIADMAYVDQSNYVSNRPLQILAAGGALLLHQHVDKMDVLLGIEHAKHFLEWSDFDDLRWVIAEFRKPDHKKTRRNIALAGKKYVLAHHTWGKRVEQLLGWLPKLQGASE